MASPHMSRPLRFIGRWIVTVGAIAGIALGVTLPIGMVAGLLIGLGSGAILHLLLGSPAGRLTLDQIATALGDLGVEATDLRHAPLEPTGVALVEAVSPDGKQLLVKVYGRDAWDGQFLASLWGSLWNRGERPSLGFSRLRQVEHEAFVTLLAERARRLRPPDRRRRHGRPSATPCWSRRAPGGASGRWGNTRSVTSSSQGIWRAVLALHELGVAHGQLDGDRLIVRPDGSAAIGDFGGARVAASDGAMMADRAQVLVTTALVVGTDRAVAAAIVRARQRRARERPAVPPAGGPRPRHPAFRPRP